jgi:hypothetical protein
MSDLVDHLRFIGSGSVSRAPKDCRKMVINSRPNSLINMYRPSKGVLAVLALPWLPVRDERAIVMENDALEWFARIDGPLSFRLILQPIVAFVLGYRDGLRDWTNGDPPYFWNLSQVLPQERAALVRDGFESIGKVFVIAALLDGLFQYLVTGTVSLAGTFSVAVILAILPYLLSRGAVNRWKSRPIS